MKESEQRVTPLGIFGHSWPADTVRVRDELLTLVGKLPEDECPAIASYLRGGTSVFAIMEGTTDIVGAFPKALRENFRWGGNILGVVGGRFAVSGGSAILTDGVFYWRRDTAEYVEHYRTALPEDFLRHGRILGWVPPQLSSEEVLAIDRFLCSARVA